MSSTPTNIVVNEVENENNDVIKTCEQDSQT